MWPFGLVVGDNFGRYLCAAPESATPPRPGHLNLNKKDDVQLLRCENIFSAVTSYSVVPLRGYPAGRPGARDVSVYRPGLYEEPCPGCSPFHHSRRAREQVKNQQDAFRAPGFHLYSSPPAQAASPSCFLCRGDSQAKPLAQQLGELGDLIRHPFATSRAWLNN